MDEVSGDKMNHGLIVASNFIYRIMLLTFFVYFVHGYFIVQIT